MSIAWVVNSISDISSSKSYDLNFVSIITECIMGHWHKTRQYEVLLSERMSIAAILE